jgi:3-deoxy-manno-octulosonate cytidylyltransferase (CMP-KDO synthetase)
VNGDPAAHRPYAILIPARYASTRLPGKMLLAESGKYLVQHVYERASEAPGSPRVIVLTDDDRIEEAVRSFGGTVWRSRGRHESGSDRCAEAAERLEEPVVVDLQGDEPLFEPADLAALAAAVDAGADIATLAHPFARAADAEDPDAVKALRDPQGWAVDFARRPPADARGLQVLHHVGIYAFARGRLLEFAALPPSAREQAERLEQLRAVDHGWRIRVLDASAPAFGVDTRADYERFLAAIR